MAMQTAILIAMSYLDSNAFIVFSSSVMERNSLRKTGWWTAAHTLSQADGTSNCLEVISR